MNKNNAHYEQIHFLHSTVNLPFHIHIFKEEHAKYEIIHSHWHRSLEIAYRIKYDGKIFINRNVYTLESDQITLINSRDYHEIHRKQDSEVYVILLIIKYDFLKSIVPNIDDYYFIINQNDMVLKQILLDIRDEYENINQYSYIKIFELCYKLIYELITRFSVNRKESNIPLINIKQDNEILQYIYDNYDKIENTSQLANHFGYSREYFSKYFTKMTGLTIKEFINQFRLNCALDLMITTKLSEPEIATKVGFSSYRAFYDSFKKRYQTTPIKYRKKYTV